MAKRLIVVDGQGEVLSSEAGYDLSRFSPFSPFAGTPIILEDGVSAYSTVKTVINPDGSTGSVPVSISPLTEQILTGTVIGQFNINEQAEQSHFIPVLVNGLTLFGNPATEYLPTIGTIGASGPELGNRSLQFKGSYLDTDTKAAGVQLPSFSTTSSPYFNISGFLYLETEPSNNYDPILLTRSADGVNSSTNDSFRLEYDTSSNQLQFHYSTASYASAGYESILNVCPANGVTLNEWHQFAIAYSNQGGSAAIASYWNGNRHAQATGLSGNIRNSTSAFMVGSGVSGDKPLKGWLEHLIVSGGGVSLALREFTHGLTAPVSTDQFAGDYTVYAMNMNGPAGSTVFPVMNANRVVSTVCWDDRFGAKIGVGNIVRETTSAGGTAQMFTGVCGGHSVSGGSGGYLFGLNSGACMIITGVDEISGGATANRLLRSSLSDFSVQYLLGATSMQGVSGGSGDFQYLLSVGQAGFCGTQFSFLPTSSNIAALRTLYDDITINGRTGTFSLADYNGTISTFASAGVKALYQDVITYATTANTVFGSVKTAISTKTSVSDLRSLGGVCAEGTVLKLAPSIASNGALLLSAKAKVTKTTNVPEQQNKQKTVYLVLGDPEPF